jgi:hypothetical protein
LTAPIHLITAHYLQSLRVAAPKEYEAFVEAFDAWATEVTVAVTTAPQDQVLQQQGRAQAYLHLLKMFRDPTNHLQQQQSNPPSA